MLGLKQTSNHKTNRRAAKGTLQIMTGRICLFGFGYFVTILLARGLGPLDYGIYGIILSVLVSIEQMGHFGIPEAVQKLVPEDNKRQPLVESTSHTIIIAIYTFLFIAFLFVAPMIARFFQLPEATNLFRLAFIDIPLSGIYISCLGILTGRRNFNVISWGIGIYGFSKLAAVLVALGFGLSIFLALIVNIIGTIGALLYLLTKVSLINFRFSADTGKIILAFALPIGLYLFVRQFLFSMDLWCLKVIGAEEGEVIGMYVAALNVARIPFLAFSGISGVILPSISMALVQQDMDMVHRYVKGAGRFLWVTLMPTIVFLALNSKEIMILLYSNRYSHGASFLTFQLVGFAMFCCAHVFGEMLIARGKPNLVAWIHLFMIPAALIFNFILVVYFGATGAAVALALTGSILAIVCGWIVFQQLGSLIEQSTFIKVCVAASVMALVNSQIHAEGPWLILKGSIVFGSFGLVLILLGELKRDDFELLVFWRRKVA